MDKETSSRVSTLAAKFLNFTLTELEGTSPEEREQLIEEMRTLAGSALSQDETPGQGDGKPARKFPPEVTATREGSRITVNVDYGPSTYQTWFSVGDARAQEAAIASLTEKICGFSTSTILIAIHNTENDHAE